MCWSIMVGVTGVEVRIGGHADLLYHAPWTIGAGGYLCPVARKVVEGASMVNRCMIEPGYLRRLARVLGWRAGMWR